MRYRKKWKIFKRGQMAKKHLRNVDIMVIREMQGQFFFHEVYRGWTCDGYFLVVNLTICKIH